MRSSLKVIVKTHCADVNILLEHLCIIIDFHFTFNIRSHYEVNISTDKAELYEGIVSVEL